MAILSSYPEIADAFRAGTHSGLNFSYGAGSVRDDNVVTAVNAGTTALADNTTNYIEVTTAGVVSDNATGFTAGRIPLFTAVTSSGSITTVTDKRCFFSAGAAGSMVYPGSGIAVSTGSAWGTSLTAPSGTIVGTSDSQTLTNKTLTSPKINEDIALTVTATQLNDCIKDFMTIAVSDESTAITTGTAKVTFRAPFAMTLYQIPRASLSTASSSGNPAIDINVGGSSIFTTTLTIDATEKTSTTAATAAVLGTTSIADDAEITIDIDTAGTGAKGLKVILYFRRT